MTRVTMILLLCILNAPLLTQGFSIAHLQIQQRHHQSKTQRNHALHAHTHRSDTTKESEKIVIIGAGWGGLSAAYSLIKTQSRELQITIVDASPRVGGLVRDGFATINNTMQDGEAGQHGFWDNYHNIFNLFEELFPSLDDVLTAYAPQGQYSPKGLEAVWPVYRDNVQLPTGLAQALYTKFVNLSPLDRASALPMVLAFSDFDDSEEAWEKYDQVSFRDLCIKLGVSRKCYDEIFEPMILTGLFAPGAECSAAAALGMAYFFVLKSQNSFDVRWCKGNIGKLIFDPWDDLLKEKGGIFQMNSRVTGFEFGELNHGTISKVICSTKTNDGQSNEIALEADKVLFSVGGAALNAMVRGSRELSKYSEFRKFSNLRGTGVLATRLYLDKILDTPYSANACWGFDRAVGMTMFDITKLHNIENATGSIIEIDYYHAASLLVMSDEQIVQKAKRDLDTILPPSTRATVVDAAVVRLPQAVNWYSPGSYANMPNVQSESIPNVYFCGDIVRSRHGSWSQEKAYVTGIEAANKMLGRSNGFGIVPLEADEPHVALGRSALAAIKSLARLGGAKKEPSFVDFLW